MTPVSIRPGWPRDARGVTLTEMTVVMVLSALVIVGLVTFYMNSQATWLDASSQAITQREATSVLAAIGRRVRPAAGAVVTFSPDSSHCQIAIVSHGQVTPGYYFWWSAADSAIHEGADTGAGDRGAMLTSRVLRFRVTGDSATVRVTSLQLRSAQGQVLDVSSTYAFVNR